MLECVMGNFYTNVTLRTDSDETVAEHMRERGRNCFVSSASRGFTTVYERVCEEQDIEVLRDLAATLSAQFKCSAFAVLNHDDDVLWVGLLRSGSWLTAYRSDQPLSGSAWRIASEFGVLGLFPVVWLLMRWPIFLFQVLRHQALASVLGLPKTSVGFGYNYLSRGEWPPNTRASDFLRV